MQISKNSITEFIKCMGKSILIITLSGVVGTILLCLVAFIPQSAIYENTKNSVRLLCSEGFGTDILSLRGSILDLYTDGLMLNIAYTSAGNVKNTLLATTLNGETEDALVPIHYYLEGLTSDTSTWNYTRYWHGYQVFLKPLLIIGNITTIRALNMVLQVSLVFTITYLMLCANSSKKFELVVPFLVFWLSLSPVAVVSSIQYYSTIYPTFIAMIALLRLKERKFYSVWYIFLITGILVGYLDLLTYPLVSLGVPLILFFCLDYWANKGYLHRLGECIAYSLSWCVGFAGMLIARWTMASIVSGTNIFHEGINRILYRTSHEYAGTNYSLLTTIKVNLAELKNPLVLFAMVFGCAFVFVNIKKWCKKVNLASLLALLFVCLYPFFWYLVVMQHSNMHQWMTYRNLCITVYGGMSVIYVHMDLGKKKDQLSN